LKTLDRPNPKEQKVRENQFQEDGRGMEKGEEVGLLFLETQRQGALVKRNSASSSNDTRSRGPKMQTHELDIEYWGTPWEGMFAGQFFRRVKGQVTKRKKNERKGGQPIAYRNPLKNK